MVRLPALVAALAAAPACAAPQIPALTGVELRIGADLGSKLSKTGDRFPIELAKPIVVNGEEVVKAGVPGEGEVVWAKKAGMSGSAGELVLAARWIEVGGRRLRLRSMNLARVGEDKIGAVTTLAIASAASPLPVSMIGYLVAGKQVFVPKGTRAGAKVAEDFAADEPPSIGQVSP